MSCSTNHLNEQTVKVVPVIKLYLSRPTEDDHNGIIITSVEEQSEIENQIPLKIKHCSNNGILQLNYEGTKFNDYFPPNTTVKISKILLTKLNIENTEFHSRIIKERIMYGDWDIIHLMTENESDCNYLFNRAIEEDYRVILAIQLKIVNADNLSQKLTFHLSGTRGPILHRAITEKDIKIIEAFCEYKLDVNVKNKAGWTSLHAAINLELPEIINILINNGADVNAINSKRQVPLHYAVMKNNLKVLEILLKSQVQLDKIDMFRQSPLFYAVAEENVEVVDILLKKGADYKLIDDSNRTAFHLSAKQQSLDIIEIFLQNNVDADILNNRGQTPFFFISETSFRTQSETDHHEKCLKIINILLQKGANINHQDLDGRTPLYYAVINDNIKFMQTLLEYNADMSILTESNQNILHVACWHRANKSIQTLINFGIDINAVDNKQKTALHIAVETKNYEAVELILQKNPNINMRDEVGKTPLHLAIQSEYLPTIELLLRNNADVNIKDTSGLIALHLASECTNIPLEIVEFILNLNNDINDRDNIGRTALHYAALSHNICTLQYLLEQNADVNVRDLAGKTPLHVAMNPKDNYFSCVKLLLDYNADINALDNDQINPLHLAFFTKHVKVAEYLLQNGADSKMKDKDGKTMYHYASIFKLNDMSISGECGRENGKDILNLLIKEDLSVNCVDNFGKTPLHYVAEDKYLFMIEFLFNVGADINIFDNEHNSPYDNFIRQWSHVRFDPLKAHFQRHIIKMKVLKLRVDEKILNQVYRPTDIENQLWILRYQRVCIREISLMKRTNINQSYITYYDFLKKNQHDAVNYTQSQHLVKTLQSDELTLTYPIYAYFLKHHLRQVLQRNIFYKKIQELLQPNVFLEKLPTLCLHEIFRYLDSFDLKMLLEALKPTVLTA